MLIMGSGIEDFVGMFDDELDNFVASLRIGDFALNIGVTHNGGSENNCDVEGRHL